MRSPVAWGRTDALVCLLLFAGAGAALVSSPNEQSGDSRYTLLVSHGLLHHGTLRLDGYGLPRKAPRDEGFRISNGDTYQIELVGEHMYEFYPAGTAILSVPLFAVAEAAGARILDPQGRFDQDAGSWLEKIIASFLMALLAVVFYAIARLFLARSPSFVLVLVAVFGSQVWSTASRALWSHCWLILLLGCAIFLVARASLGGFDPPALALGTLLAWIYFVRPTGAFSIVVLLACVLQRSPGIAARLVATGAVWLGGFVAHSWVTYRALVPPYYKNPLEIDTFADGLMGTLVSPSRGLLVFVPWTAAVAVLLIAHRRRLPAPGMAAGAALAILANVLLVACFRVWWGGHCYGPRYTTDSVPWLFFLAVVALRAHLDSGRSVWALAPAAPLVAFALFANGQGALEELTLGWSGKFLGSETMRSPALWDWSRPQFLAGLAPQPDKYPPLTGRLLLGATDADAYLIDGFSWRDDGGRWTQARRAYLAFEAPTLAAGTLQVRMRAFVSPDHPAQRVELSLNGHELAELTAGRKPQVYDCPIPAGVLRRENLLAFGLPDSRSPRSLGKSTDSRRLGVFVEWIALGSGPPVGGAATPDR